MYKRIKAISTVSPFPIFLGPYLPDIHLFNINNHTFVKSTCIKYFIRQLTIPHVSSQANQLSEIQNNQFMKTRPYMEQVKYSFKNIA